EKYIETVPKRGYRFLVSVRIVAETPEELSVSQHVLARSSGQHVGAPATAAGSISGAEEASRASVITVAPEDVMVLDHSGSPLQPAVLDIAETRDQRRAKTRNATIFVVLLVVALGGSALIYKFARRVNPPASFQ